STFGKGLSVGYGISESISSTSRVQIISEKGLHKERRSFHGLTRLNCNQSTEVRNYLTCLDATDFSTKLFTFVAVSSGISEEKLLEKVGHGVAQTCLIWFRKGLRFLGNTVEDMWLSVENVRVASSEGDTSLRVEAIPDGPLQVTNLNLKLK
ncbi:HNOBA domain-containing protein, partial [Trichonephila clavata]